MKYYEQLLDMGCFNREALYTLTGNYNTAGTLLKNYTKKGYVRQVKRNLYVAINLADHQPVVNKYRIAGAITKSSYISHHAAFEYYGCANQVSYQVEVSSDTPFTTFEFDRLTFLYIASRITEGLVTRLDGVRVTDMERTVLDSINDFEKVAGLEEVLRCIDLAPSLKEDKLLEYLALYGKQVLYQKTGYILRHYKNTFNISEDFFNVCAAKINKSTRYLTGNIKGSYNGEWRLMVPADLMKITDKGVRFDGDL